MQMKVVSTGSKGNCIVLEHNNQIILLDCGVPIKDILEAVNFNPSKIEAVLVSHSHCDHASSAKKLTEMFIEVVMAKQTAFELDIPENTPTLSLVDSDSQLNFGDWIIKSFELEHDAYNIGFIIYNRVLNCKIVYVSDTGFIRYTVPDTDILIVEANFIDDLLDEYEDNSEQRMRIKKNHMSLSRLCSYIRKIDSYFLKHIVLVHLSSKNSDEQRMADEMAKFTNTHTIIAKQGMNVNFEKGGI